MKVVRHLPNFITCLNLLCGCLAIVFISRNQLSIASWLVILAAFFDFLDGFVARILQAHSEIGKQLDSLADMITFGLVPGFMMHKILDNSTDLFLLEFPILTYVPFLVTIFSALRLAKFNIDERQADGFIGLPTPACTLFVISIPLIQEHGFGLLEVGIASPPFLLTSSILLSFLLVAELPMIAFKFKNFSWEGNQVRYIFLVTGLLMLLMFNFVAIPVFIVLYICWSLVQKITGLAKK